VPSLEMLDEQETDPDVLEWIVEQGNVKVSYEAIRRF
jgi:hypothetical protein